MTTLSRAGTPQPLRLMREINGKSYALEVLPVDRCRWRARLAQHGTTNALMPFYGATPDEAAASLTAWLVRVGRPKASALG